MRVVLKDLTKVFTQPKGRESVTAVDHFNIEIPDGKLVALLGPSGCGKSTALNLICGLETPTQGHIFFGDTDVTDIPPEHRGVGMVFQNYALYPHMSVEQNIRFPLENLKGEKKLSKETMAEKVLEAARLVQIDGQLDRKPSQLSGGQQQRVAIARALVRMPSVLLLDEPLSNLDARLRLQTREEIRRIQKETQITTVFVTHDQEEAMSISDMIIVMKSGQIQQMGRPQEVYDNPVNLFVAKFLGTPQINVFEGRISGGKVYIGEDIICDSAVCGADDSSDDVFEDGSADMVIHDEIRSNEIVRKGAERKVYVCIRPEGLIPDEGGSLSCSMQRVEIMGRDTSILSTHAGCEAPLVRAIVRDVPKNAEAGGEIRFAIKPEKLFIFDRETQQRIG